MQRQITASLNRQLSTIDSVLASLTRQIELLREHRQALITAAVTGQIEIPGVAA
jgi:type I restriction enzyme S subunit